MTNKDYYKLQLKKAKEAENVYRKELVECIMRVISAYSENELKFEFKFAESYNALYGCDGLVFNDINGNKLSSFGIKLIGKCSDWVIRAEDIAIDELEEILETVRQSFETNGI